MTRSGFLYFFLLTLAVIESVIPFHLSLIGVLILLNFIPIRALIWLIFITGLALDLLLGNFLGVNSAIFIAISQISNSARNAFWPNLTYAQFRRHLIALTIFQVIVLSRIYNFFYNLVSFGIVTFDFAITTIPVEIITTLILFPIISYLSFHWVSQKQLELKF